MEPMNFEQANKNLLKPQGMTDDECRSLPVFNNGEQCISLWKMTWRERFSALFFGKIWLYVYSGITQPPVGLLATRDIFPELPKAKLLQIERRTFPSEFSYLRFANAGHIDFWWFAITWRLPWLEGPKQAHYEMNYGVKRTQKEIRHG